MFAMRQAFSAEFACKTLERWRLCMEGAIFIQAALRQYVHDQCFLVCVCGLNE